jgi:hypothetical protein
LDNPQTDPALCQMSREKCLTDPDICQMSLEKRQTDPDVCQMSPAVWLMSLEKCQMSPGIPQNSGICPEGSRKSSRIDMVRQEKSKIEAKAPNPKDRTRQIVAN